MGRASACEVEELFDSCGAMGAERSVEKMRGAQASMAEVKEGTIFTYRNTA